MNFGGVWNWYDLWCLCEQLGQCDLCRCCIVCCCNCVDVIYQCLVGVVCFYFEMWYVVVEVVGVEGGIGVDCIGQEVVVQWVEWYEVDVQFLQCWQQFMFWFVLLQ